MYNITSIIDLKWANEAHDVINFKVKFNELPDYIDYYLGQQDLSTFAKSLWTRVVSGEWGQIQEWDPTVCNLDSIVVPVQVFETDLPPTEPSQP